MGYTHLLFFLLCGIVTITETNFKMKTVILVLAILVAVNMSTAVSPPKPPCACQLIYAPVCALKTYPNDCSAKCDGARVVENRPCKEPRGLMDVKVDNDDE